MSDIMEYKCPACGGAMEFDSKSQQMRCPYCDSAMSVEEFQQMQEEKQEKETEQNTQPEEGNHWQEGETDGMRVYSCESCGGEIVADENTGATICPFCGNRVLMKGQFTGGLKPDFIIPFKTDKKDAKNAYLNHLNGKAFLPTVFKDENHIDEIKGVYVPFWLFDGDVEAKISYNAEKTSVWESGDTEYTEHEYYRAKREGSIQYAHIPADGSKKMDDTLMESIEPYDFKDAVPFNTAYLAGYAADRYDVDQNESMLRAQERVKKSVEDSFRSTVSGYDYVAPTESDINITRSTYTYALYPVWLLHTTWQGKKYTFAMNGQTGAMVGDLPADKKAFRKYVIIRGLIIGAIIYAIMGIMGI